MGNKSSKSNRKEFKTSKSHLKQDGTWTPILDDYHNLEDVQQGLRRAGLESSNLIFGIDFTSSNEWQGKRTFNGQNLHSLSAHKSNPYEECLDIISRTLSPFDDDDIIPAFGFGCSNTNDHSVLDIGTCHGLTQLLQKYRSLIPHVKLAGPTSFGPLIRRAVDVVVADNNSYHILVIIADGAITRPQSIAKKSLSQFEKDTIDAIVEASNYPLSIVMVGVGDGPWHQMEEFDDRLPARKFDNFQFVSFDSVKTKAKQSQPNLQNNELEARFALDALMEIPEQYQAILTLQLIGSSNRPNRPPQKIVAAPIIPAPIIPTPAPPTTVSGGAVPVVTDGSIAPYSEVPYAPSISGGVGHTNNSIPMAQVMEVNQAQNNVPPMFLCPLSQTIMINPVICLDGHTYEKNYITEFFKINGAISPVTNQPLDGTQLFDNSGMKSAIQNWRIKQ